MLAPPPELARRVQHVEVRHVRERRLEAVEQVARLDERHVEGPAVEGDQAVEPPGERRERVEQFVFGLVAAQEELAGVETVGVEEAAARPGTPASRRRRSGRSSRGRRTAAARRRDAGAPPVVGQAPARAPLEADRPRLARRRRGPFVGRQHGQGRQAAGERLAVVRDRLRGRAACRGRSGARARRSRGRRRRAGRSRPRSRRSAPAAVRRRRRRLEGATESRAPPAPASRSSSRRRDERREVGGICSAPRRRRISSQ